MAIERTWTDFVFLLAVNFSLREMVCFFLIYLSHQLYVLSFETVDLSGPRCVVLDVTDLDEKRGELLDLHLLKHGPYVFHPHLVQVLGSLETFHHRLQVWSAYGLMPNFTQFLNQGLNPYSV
jgi:hypothetical protein